MLSPTLDNDKIYKFWTFEQKAEINYKILQQMYSIFQ